MCLHTFGATVASVAPQITNTTKLFPRTRLTSRYRYVPTELPNRPRRAVARSLAYAAKKRHLTTIVNQVWLGYDWQFARDQGDRVAVEITARLA